MGSTEKITSERNFRVPPVENLCSLMVCVTIRPCMRGEAGQGEAGQGGADAQNEEGHGKAARRRNLFLCMSHDHAGRSANTSPLERDLQCRHRRHHDGEDRGSMSEWAVTRVRARARRATCS